MCSQVAALALPDFCFKNLNAFTQARLCFGKPFYLCIKNRQKSFAAHTGHPEPVLSIVLNAAQGWAMYGILTMGQQWLQISNLKR